MTNSEMSEAKDSYLVLRISEADKRLVAAAAGADELSTSTWARRAVMRAAREWAVKTGWTAGDSAVVLKSTRKRGSKE